VHTVRIDELQRVPALENADEKITLRTGDRARGEGLPQTGLGMPDGLMAQRRDADPKDWKGEGEFIKRNGILELAKRESQQL
jgi:hypothetical protein